MYGDLDEVNDNLSENSEDDDIVNNPDDLVQSDVEEIPIQNNVSGDEAANGKGHNLCLPWVIV